MIVGESAAKPGVFSRSLCVNLGSHNKPDARPNHVARVTLFHITLYQNAVAVKAELRNATNLTDVPAEIIAYIFSGQCTICIIVITVYEKCDYLHLLHTAYTED